MRFFKLFIKLVQSVITCQLLIVIKNHGGVKGVLRSVFISKAHNAPPIDDFSLMVPFKYPIDTWHPSVAVICHMFYTEMLDEIIIYLNNIPFPFDLYITTDTNQKKIFIESKLHLWNKGALTVRLSPNRGRDIAPKLITCRDVHQNYEFVLHIHTKRSNHLGVINEWRTYLLDSLLGSKEIVASIFEAFKQDRQLGMVAPQHYNMIRNAIGWGYNEKIARKFLRNKLQLPFPKQLDFPSGSMFWARTSSLKPLLDLNLQLKQFDKENNQYDGTLAHVIERMFFLVCELAGYRWIKIADRVKEEAKVRSIDIVDQEQLIWAIGQIQKS